MVIGKSAKPHAFRNLNMSSLPVHYRKQTKGWINSALFKEWFHDEFVPHVKKFCLENDLSPKAILFIDNAPSHPAADELINGDIKVSTTERYFDSVAPRSGSSNHQTFLQKKILGRLLEEDEKNPTIPGKLKKINIKDVVYWSADA